MAAHPALLAAMVALLALKVVKGKAAQAAAAVAVAVAVPMQGDTAVLMMAAVAAAAAHAHEDSCRADGSSWSRQSSLDKALHRPSE